MKLEAMVAFQALLFAAVCAGANSQSTPASPESSNCTAPVLIDNQFNITDLKGWELLSHEDYLSNSASMHYHNLNCSWLIHRPSTDAVVVIRIHKLELESGPGCPYDSLQLEYANYSNNTKVNKRFCGSVLNRVLLANSDVTVTFRTDQSMNYHGFHLQWAFVNASLAMKIKESNKNSNDTCSKPRDLQQVTLASITAPGGRLLSHDEYLEVPNLVYKNSLNCQWTLTSPTGYILLWIEELLLEYSARSGLSACEFDNLTINFTNAVTGLLENREFCGLTYDRLFLSNTSVTMKFMTDTSVGSRGFYIKWMYLNESQFDTAVQVWNFIESNSTINCTEKEPMTLRLDGVGSYPGGRLLSHTEFLTNFSSNYHPNMNCSWSIDPPDNSTLIHINIPTLELEMGSASLYECRYDNVTISFTNAVSNRSETKVICSSSLHSISLTSSAKVTIRFVTDHSVTKRGFQLLWYFVPTRDANKLLEYQTTHMPPTPTSEAPVCSKPQDQHQVTLASITAPGGRLVSHDEYSPRYGSKYANNLDCRWTLTSITGFILLWIEDLQLEFSTRGKPCNYDNLTLIFDNAVTGKLQNETLCRSDHDLMYLSNSSIAMRFKTDSSVGSRGFHIKWMYLNESQARTAIQFWKILANNSITGCVATEAMNLTLDGIGTYPGGRLVSHAQFLTNLSSNYHPNMNCSWTIDPPNNSTLIHVKVPTIQLETSGASVCRYDNLTFAFKNAVTNRFERRVACTSLKSISFTSSGRVTIKFATDHSVSKRGFQLLWYFISRRNAFRLPNFENMQNINCPPLRQQEGSHVSGRYLLILMRYARNSHCLWRWDVREGQVTKFRLRIVGLDSRDDSMARRMSTEEAACSNARDRLRLRYFNAEGTHRTEYFCGHDLTGVGRRTIVAHPGHADLTFTSDESVEGRGFLLVYWNEQIVTNASNCPEVRRLSKHESRLTIQWPRFVERNCSWTIAPKDSNYMIVVAPSTSTSSFLSWQIRNPRRTIDLPGQFRASRRCHGDLTVSSTMALKGSDLWRMYSTVYSNDSRSDDASAFTSPETKRVCLSYRRSRLNPLLAFVLSSIGPVGVTLETQAMGFPLELDLIIMDVPTVSPGAKDLCSQPVVLGTHHLVIEKNSRRRLVSLKRMSVASSRDCRTVFRVKDKAPPVSTVFHSSAYIEMIMISVNCSHPDGSVAVVTGDNVTSVSCNSVAKIGWANPQGFVALVAEDTQGFRAKLDHLIWTLESTSPERCPTYRPTSDGKWISNVPLIAFVDMPDSHAPVVMPMLHCIIKLSPDADHDLMVQVKFLFNQHSAKHICDQLSQQHFNRPHLTLRLSAPNSGGSYFSLCDDSFPGGDRIPGSLRVPLGGSIVVDVMTTWLTPRDKDSNATDFIRTSVQTGIDALLVVHQVDSCTSFISQDWMKSADSKEVYKAISIAPNNTQTDCSFQLAASTAVRIAKENEIQMNPTVGCWNVKVMLDKFATTCGLNQLTLTVSHWDSVAGSIAHRQIDVCGNRSFSYSLPVGMEPEIGTGVSVQYSGVRSGFAAQFSVSECGKSMDNSLLRGRSVSGKDNVESALTVSIVLLVLANLCLLLFFFRARIVARVRAFASERRRPRVVSISLDGNSALLSDDFD